MAAVEEPRRAPLDIVVEAGATGPVIALQGELDLSNTDDLESVLDRQVGRSPGSRVTFDLSGLRFMDSSGIALLLRTAAQGTAVCVLRPSTAVERLLEVTGLIGVLRVER